MNMDTATQQFAFRTFILTVCGLIGGMFLYMAAVGMIQGDGEAIRIIDSLTPMMRDTLLALVAMITGQQIVHGVVTAKSQGPAQAAQAAAAQTVQAVQAVQAVQQAVQAISPNAPKAEADGQSVG